MKEKILSIGIGILIGYGLVNEETLPPLTECVCEQCQEFDYSKCSLTIMSSSSNCGFLSHKSRSIVRDLECSKYLTDTKCSFIIDGNARVHYTGEGTSMVPFIQRGNYMIYVESDDIETGDFVSFWNDKGYTVLHQVVGVYGGDDFCYITKGVNNKVNDTYCVPPDKIIGRVSVIFRDSVR